MPMQTGESLEQLDDRMRAEHAQRAADADANLPARLRELLRMALKMGGVFDRIVNPTTRGVEMDRIWCAITPGSFSRPYKKPPVVKDGDVAPVPLHMHPATRAREALTQWKGRGVRVERAGDGLRLTGPTHAGDLANAAELKAEILSQLPAEVVV